MNKVKNCIDQDQLFSLLHNAQHRRMDDQRCSFEPFKKTSSSPKNPNTSPTGNQSLLIINDLLIIYIYKKHSNPNISHCSGLLQWKILSSFSNWCPAFRADGWMTSAWHSMHCQASRTPALELRERTIKHWLLKSPWPLLYLLRQQKFVPDLPLPLWASVNQTHMSGLPPDWPHFPQRDYCMMICLHRWGIFTASIFAFDP